MRCESIMKREVECVMPQTTAQDAAQRMRDDGIGFLPVCDESRKVLGTVTDRDLATRVLAEGRPASTRVDSVLTREVVACRPEDDLRRAEELMAQHQKSRIMCVDDTGALVGVISLSDIARKEKGTRTSQVYKEVKQPGAHL
jgi:CBS domain-containing protein